MLNKSGLLFDDRLFSLEHRKLDSDLSTAPGQSVGTSRHVFFLHGSFVVFMQMFLTTMFFAMALMISCFGRS